MRYLKVIFFAIFATGSIAHGAKPVEKTLDMRGQDDAYVSVVSKDDSVMIQVSRNIQGIGHEDIKNCEVDGPFYPNASPSPRDSYYPDFSSETIFFRLSADLNDSLKNTCLFNVVGSNGKNKVVRLQFSGKKITVQ